MSLIKKVMIPLIVLLATSAFSYEVGDRVSCVNLSDMHNAQPGSCVERRNLPSHKFTMVEFFTTTCGYCDKNLPNISQIAREYAGTTTTRFISLTRNVSRVRSYISSRAQHFHFSVAIDNTGLARRSYGARYVPTLFVVDRNNVVVYKHVGLMGPSDLQTLRAILNRN